MKTNTSGRRNRLQFSMTAQHLVDSAFIAWSAASPDSSPEFWLQPCVLCCSLGRKPPPPSPLPPTILSSATALYSTCQKVHVLRHQLYLTCLDLLGFPVLIILFGLDGWWLKYSTVKYSWYLSHTHTHIQVCLALETVFFMRFELLCCIWEGFFPFFSVVWSNSAFLWHLHYCSSLFFSLSFIAVWMAPYPAMWKSRTTPCSSRALWPTTWLGRMSVTLPTASGLAPASWTSTSQVGWLSWSFLSLQ